MLRCRLGAKIDDRLLQDDGSGVKYVKRRDRRKFVVKRRSAVREYMILAIGILNIQGYLSELKTNVGLGFTI